MTSIKLTRNEQAAIPLGYEHIVERSQYDLVDETWKKRNREVKEFMAAETALSLSVKGKLHRIQVSTTNYVLPQFHSVVGLVRMENWLLGQKSSMLHYVQSGTQFLREYLDIYPTSQKQLNLTDFDIKSVRQFEQTIDKVIDNLPHWQIDILKSLMIMDVEEGIMGRYHLVGRHVELHWIPIVIIAECMKVSIKDLTLVVFVHELAHAYTHSGMDVGGGYWKNDHFLDSDKSVTEGLAQYYTYLFLSKLKEREPEPLEVFNRLLEYQPLDYHTHKKWLEGNQAGQGEATRLALLEARLEKKGCKEERFFDFLDENKSRLGH